jgi:hypothetical protein
MVAAKVLVLPSAFTPGLVLVLPGTFTPARVSGILTSALSGV